MKLVLRLFLGIMVFHFTSAYAGGCSLHGYSSGNGGMRLVDFPGNNNFKNHFFEIAKSLAYEFGADDENINSKIFIGIVDDYGTPNAFATNDFNEDQTPYAVLFGENLIYDLAIPLNNGLNTIKIEAVLAHEFAHISQFQAIELASIYDEPIVENALKRVRTVNLELMADMLAGWYMARRYRSYDTSIGAFIYPQPEQFSAIGKKLKPILDQFYSIGDFDFNNIDHHGTPRQRLNAIMRGVSLRLHDEIEELDDAFIEAYEAYIGSFPEPN